MAPLALILYLWLPPIWGCGAPPLHLYERSASWAAPGVPTSLALTAAGTVLVASSSEQAGYEISEFSLVGSPIGQPVSLVQRSVSGIASLGRSGNIAVLDELESTISLVKRGGQVFAGPRQTDVKPRVFSSKFGGAVEGLRGLAPGGENFLAVYGPRQPMQLRSFPSPAVGSGDRPLTTTLVYSLHHLLASRICDVSSVPVYGLFAVASFDNEGKRRLFLLTAASESAATIGLVVVDEDLGEVVGHAVLGGLGAPWGVAIGSDAPYSLVVGAGKHVYVFAPAKERVAEWCEDVTKAMAANETNENRLSEDGWCLRRETASGESTGGELGGPLAWRGVAGDIDRHAKFFDLPLWSLLIILLLLALLLLCVIHQRRRIRRWWQRMRRRCGSWWRCGRAFDRVVVVSFDRMQRHFEPDHRSVGVPS